MAKQPRSVEHHRVAVRPVPAKKKAEIVRPEDLTVEERAALAEKIEAARQRGRPPSI